MTNDVKVELINVCGKIAEVTVKLIEARHEFVEASIKEGYVY